MPKRGENIYKRKDGRWEGRYIRQRTAAGKAVYGYVYARTYTETKQKLKNALKQQVVSSPGQTGILESPCFYVLAEDWFEHIRPLTKESTYRKYRNLWNSYIHPELGGMRFSELTQDKLESYCAELLASGGREKGGLSAKTVSDTMSLIRGIFQFCAGRKIPVPCDTRAVTVKQSAKEMRVFTLNEQKIICSYIYSNPSLQNIGILLCLFTGIRVGEVCALRWEDISLSEKTLRIHQTMQRIQTDEEDGENAGEGNPRTKVIVSTPKSKCSIRTIPLPDELVQILYSVVPKSTDAEPPLEGGDTRDLSRAGCSVLEQKKEVSSVTGYFLTGSDTKWIEPRTMQNHFKRVLKQCGIPDANYHTLRHTFATRCVELGFDVKTLSEILGHASVNITMNRYVHPSMQLKQENMQRLSGLFAVR